MRIITKFLLFSLIILICCVATVSATDNITDVEDKEYISISQQLINDNVESTVKETNIETKSKQKSIEKINNTGNPKESTVLTVTTNSYDQFFTTDSGSEYPKTTDLIRNGDIINLKGTFNNQNFIVDKNITLTSLNNDAHLTNCTVYVIGPEASGSTISNLDIFNDGTLRRGIQVKNASNLTVRNNHVVTYGLRAYGFVADYMNDSLMESNYFERDGDDWRYIAFVIGKSHHNTIANNTIICGANGIYLSIYGSAEANFDGGPCNYNNITGNTITARGYITSWCYTIQVMGGYNTVTYNTVIGGFRGISTQDYENNYIAYNDVQAINEGIYACENATVIYNNIHVNQSATGITVGSDNVKVTENQITTMDGYGIDIRGNNILISNNNITSTGSNGIYLKGQYTGITIDNNKIESFKDGILFKHQTRTKKTNNIYVDRNNIDSQSDYAINLEETGAQNPSDINVTVTAANVLSSNKGRGMIAYIGPLNANENILFDSNQQITITPQNYTEWFTDSIANDNVEQNATITLKGTFNNTDFIFNKKTHIIGDNCHIINGTITFRSDAHQSTITNVKFTNKEHTVTKHAIELLEVNNCEITNVEIENFADYESFGIFLYGANGNTIKDNKINTSGDYANDAIFLYGSDLNILTNNTIKLNQSSLRLEYAESIMFNEKVGEITEVLHNHGIMLLYSSGNDINKNDINITSMFDSYTFPENDCKNSVVGIDVYFDSHRNKINNNNINIKSFGPYVYGIGVLGGQWGTSPLSVNATANEYKNNIVNLEGGYYATGFIAGRNSVNTLVESNIFNIKVYKNDDSWGDYAQTIVLENSTDSNIINNTMTSSAIALYNMELFYSNNNNIINNTINGTATYPYGLAATTSSNNNITGNTFILRKEEHGEPSSAQHSDSIEAGDEAIMFSYDSMNNNITLNTINTNATTTVKLTRETMNNIVMENSLVSINASGDNSVNDLGTNNVVSHNFVHYVNATADEVYAYLGDTITLVAHINTTTTDYSNLSVSFKLGANNVGTSRVVNGKASLKYNVSTLGNPTTYQITAYVSGTNFQNATAVSQAVFDRYPEETNVKVDKVLATVGSNATLSANITTVSGGKIGSGQAEFYVDGVKVDTVDLRLGVASCTYSIASNAVNKVYNVTVIYLGTRNYLNATGSNILGVQSVSTITVKNHTATIDNTANIKANITSGGKNIATGKVDIYIDNNKLTTANISKGTINTNVTIPTTFNKGKHALNIVYAGNDTLSSCISTATITLNPITPVFHYNTTYAPIGANVSLVLIIDNGRTGSDLFTANDGNVSVELNGQLLKDSNANVISGTPNKGKLTFKFVAPAQLEGYQNLSFIYTGNNKFGSSKKTIVNALKIGKEDIIIKVAKISSVKYKSNVTITGNITDTKNKGLKNINALITINGKLFKAKTNTNGTFLLTATANAIGTNNVTVGYGGNDRYNSLEVNTTFKVTKQNLLITFNPIQSVRYKDNVTITGKFTDANGRAISNSNVIITINGKTFKAKSSTTGDFTLVTSANTLGTNNVTLSYAGNDRYNKVEIKTTFKVVKQDLLITVDPIQTVRYKDNVTITGKFTDANGRAISNSNVVININGKTFKAKSSTTGDYILVTSANTLGTNNVTLGYAGNAKYNSFERKTIFKVTKQDLLITVDPIQTVRYKDNVTITGKFTDANGRAISNSNVVININGKTFNAKSSSTGDFTLVTSVNIIGTNNVTLGYAGNAKYNKVEIKTTFKVVKQDLLIICNPIKTVKLGQNVTISGKFTDANGRAIVNCNVAININGKTFNAKSSSTGDFTLVTSANTVGTNNVTLSYPGNSKYNKCETNTTFKVTS